MVKVARDRRVRVVLRRLQLCLRTRVSRVQLASYSDLETHENGMQRAVKRDICGGKVVAHDIRLGCKLGIEVLYARVRRQSSAKHDSL